MEHPRTIFAPWEDFAHALAATGSQDINGVWGIFCNRGMNIIFLGDVTGRVGSSALVRLGKRTSGGLHCTWAGS
jgi:hypothetical protein